MANNVNLQDDLENRVEGILYNNFKKGLIFFFVFLIFSINLFSVSLALQCNAGKSIFYRISSALFAFMFGFLYIIMNYLMFRVNLKNNPCQICSDLPFPIMGKDLDYM